MKKETILLFAYICMFCLFSSCDNDDSIPESDKTISIKSAEIIHPRMAKGSADGWIVYDKDTLIENEYNVNRYYADFNSMEITFKGGTDSLEIVRDLLIGNSIYKSIYKFEGEILKIWDKENESWKVFGYGNKDKLIVPKSYTAFASTGFKLGAVVLYYPIDNNEYK